ncbi:MAG: cytochrome c biogenesis protein CcsA [Planctomycetaceae bacterium]|nr:cytochrome c biogenesis protein CcsA [Planctomycetaceae bacterium]
MSTIPASQPKVRHADGTFSQAEELLIRFVVAPLASLKLAVASFALSIIIILVGTLAQVDRDIWEVMELYFKPWVTRIDATIFYPRTWFPGLEPATAVRSFAGVTLGCSIVAALMTLANAQQIKRAGLIAGIILAIGVAISVATLKTGGFLFPGGATIGALMCVNLLAAHSFRFKIRAKGKQLWIGLAVTLVGVVVTWAVIRGGHNSDGFQGEPPISWADLWVCIKIALTTSAVGLIVFALLPGKASAVQKITRRICGGLGLTLAMISLWLWVSGDSSYMGDSGMRILWQLILGLFAGAVLYFGCLPLFGRRAGVVLLHGGILLMMFGQWFVTQYDVEEQMSMAEGQALNYGQDIRSVELAVIERKSADFSGQDDVLTIPMTQNGESTTFLQNGKISDPQLPFDIEVVDYKKSSQVKLKDAEDKSPANQGRGDMFVAADSRAASGAAGGDVNIASGYFRFVSKAGDELGTVLLSQDQLMMRDGRAIDFSTEEIEVDGKVYDAQLRFVRNYKDYTVELLDVSKDDYIGTTIPRNYSSDIKLTDDSRGVDRELTIWMNNPWRYAGETFYQSGWQMDAAGNEYTTLQVVRNQGWMIPYVSCMVCLVGLLAHFSGVLVRFLDRQTRVVMKPDQSGERDGSDGNEQLLESKRNSGLAQWIVPTLVVVTAAAILVMTLRAPEPAAGEPNVYAFGNLPIVYQGRVKPYDTLARNSLRVIADAETFKGVLPPKELKEKWGSIQSALVEKWPELKDSLSDDSTGDALGLVELITEKTDADQYSAMKFVDKQMCERQPATRWLLDVITGSESAMQHKVVRIYHPEVLDLFGLQRRKGYRYAIAELTPKIAEFERQVRQAGEIASKDAGSLSVFQRKLLELDRKLKQFMLLRNAFTPPVLPPLPTEAEFENDRSLAQSKMVAFKQAVVAHEGRLKTLQPPLSVAPVQSNQEWQSYSGAWPMQFLQTQVLGKEPDVPFKAMNELLVSYATEDAAGFNSAVDEYHRQLKLDPPKDLQVKSSLLSGFITKRFGSFYAFETAFNEAAPFLVCAVFYVIAFVLLAFGWLGCRTTMNRAAFWLLIFTFIIHTLALGARIYISGRPPVTNLYSSAVFIGWGAVLLALIIEALFRSGIASVIAAVSGFATLLIAHKLAGDGDTFEVLQAVLDTQFWLATHVVTITFGYAATFLAGLLGVLYILGGVMTPSLTKARGAEIARMIYGILCFAILFSFIGTVLGGLWADDSWGRFWGWDPKENGALIIVIWNALILHARWDGMVKERGLAVLSVVGNIVTAWSWFGVNELGVGLHSYGFTEGRLVALSGVVLMHLLIVAVGWLPLSAWWSFRRNGPIRPA